MINGVTPLGGIQNITQGQAASSSASMMKETSQFKDLLNSIQAEQKDKKKAGIVHTESVSSSMINSSGKIGGDIISGFTGTHTAPSDKAVLPSGAAANTASASSPKGSVDKTSRLYEKSLELESYFVKIMLNSMRNTVVSSGNKQNEYAKKMYEDMMYDEMAVSMTKNAGFGLADQIYLQLSR